MKRILPRLALVVAARRSSNLRFKDCVGYGYIVGRDEAARRRGFEDIRVFLNSALTGAALAKTENQR